MLLIVVSLMFGPGGRTMSLDQIDRSRDTRQSEQATLRCVNLTPYRVNFVVDDSSTGWVRPDHFVPVKLEVGPHTVFVDDDSGKRRQYFVNLPSEGYDLKIRGE